MAGYQFSGGGCCCCLTFYESTGGSVYFHNYLHLPSTEVSPTDPEALQSEKYHAPDPWGPDFAVLNSFDFDPKNSLIFGCVVSKNTAPGYAYLIKYDKQYRNPEAPLVTLTPTSTTTIRCCAADWANERVFYTMIITSGGVRTGYLRRVDYDGTNDTLLTSWTEVVAVNTSGMAVAYCRTNGKAYFIAAKSGDAASIYSINADGSGEVLVVSHGSNTRVIALDIDHVNSKLVYNERDFTGIGSPSGYLRRCNLDGSNIETIYIGAPVAASPTTNAWRVWEVQYCAKSDRVWWSMDNAGPASTDFNGGIWSVRPDGTDARMEISRWMNDNADANVVSNVFRLGCGIEQTGPATLG